jgi:hypothetical protein
VNTIAPLTFVKKELFTYKDKKQSIHESFKIQFHSAAVGCICIAGAGAIFRSEQGKLRRL